MILDLAISLCVLVSLFMLGSKLPYALGGSVSMIVLLPGFYYISYVCKRAQAEMRVLSLVVLLIIGANYLHYVDISGSNAKTIIVAINCILVLLVLFLFAFVLLKPLTHSTENHNNYQLNVLRKNYKSLVLKYLIFPFIYVLATCLVFVSAEQRYSIKGNFLNIVPISFLWLSIALVALLSTILKNESNYIIYIFNHIDSRLPDESATKKSYAFFLSFIVVIGSAIELFRGSWILWSESLVIINVAVLSMWTLYKYRCSEKSGFPSTIVTDIKPADTPQSLAKLVILNIVGIMLVIVALIALLVRK